LAANRISYDIHTIAYTYDMYISDFPGSSLALTVPGLQLLLSTSCKAVGLEKRNFSFLQRLRKNVSIAGRRQAPVAAWRVPSCATWTVEIKLVIARLPTHSHCIHTRTGRQCPTQIPAPATPLQLPVTLQHSLHDAVLWVYFFV
jgi:hypothetical protein